MTNQFSGNEEPVQEHEVDQLPDSRFLPDLGALWRRRRDIFAGRARPEIFPVRADVSLACAAACQLLDMRGGIGRGNPAEVSHRILCSNIALLEVPWIRTSFAPGIELEEVGGGKNRLGDRRGCHIISPAGSKSRKTQENLGVS